MHAKKLKYVRPMLSALFPAILLATAMSFCTASAQTNLTAQGAGATSSGSAKESPREKPLKVQETASADIKANPKAETGKVAQPAEIKSTAPEFSEYYESGLALLDSGKFDEAVVKFKQAVKEQPGNVQAHYSLGVAYEKSNKYSEAAESFKRATRLKPDWAEPHFGLGCVYYVLDKKNQALDEYKKLQNLNSARADKLLQIISTGMIAAAPAARQSLSLKQRDLTGNEKIYGSAAKQESARSNSSPASSAHAAAPVAQPGRTPLAPAAAPEVALSGNPKSASPAAGPVVISANKTSNSANEGSGADEAKLTQTYRVGVGDIIDIRLSFNPSTNRSTLYTVLDQGMIEFPLVGGMVSVEGATVEEIRARLGAELTRREIQGNTPLSVAVRQYASHAVIVGGLVGFPGTRNLKREAVPLYVLLAEAQPRPEAARATILREGNSPLVVDLGDQSALNVLVRPGDTISLSARPQEFYYIAGRINYPGQKAYRAGITLLQAILASGGFIKPSDDVAEISREGAGGRLTTTKYRMKEIKAGKVEDPRLQPGDRIEVAH
jgi:protein involved in polysaccharide export with SLBB domain